MKTYIIQYWKDGYWLNYVADDGSTIEFMQRNHAETVSRDLAEEGYQDAMTTRDWQLVDSTGEKYSIGLFNQV